MEAFGSVLGAFCSLQLGMRATPSTTCMNSRSSWAVKASEEDPNLLFLVLFCDRVAQIDSHNSLQAPWIALLASACSTGLGTRQQLRFEK